mmetsp:Transcript_20491/g.52007  ORF Transcript_20491/g.52007 Transcript_20491/m.52007 type:complete len:80 (+) Transcript_20491:188-427(+)
MVVVSLWESTESCFESCREKIPIPVCPEGWRKSVCRASPSSTEDDVKVGDVVEAAVPAGDGTNDGSLSRCLDDAPSDQM